jgi:hypothetical protein
MEDDQFDNEDLGICGEGKKFPVRNPGLKKSEGKNEPAQPSIP